jgi:hypothetical protein
MATDAERAAIEFAKCAADAAYFCNEYLTIDDAQDHGDGGGTMPFHLWPAQVGVMWQLMSERLIIILKARQLGITWLCCAYALWLCLFQPGKVVLMYSRGQSEANKNLRRVKKLYERMPDWLLEALPERITDNTTIQEWAHGSRIESLPASPGAGRGDTASVVIFDEAAFQQFADELYSALKPTIDNGGQLIVLSTANGIGNLFHQLWTKAIAQLSTYKTIFLPWWTRPGRDAAWYAKQLDEATDPAIVKQEYPATANEAFIVSGRVRFPSEWIAKQAPNARAGLPRDQWPKSLQHITGLTIYSLPQAGRRYVIGGDVAEGLEHGDYSAAALIEQTTWEEIASLHGHWEPDEYAAHLVDLAVVYGAVIGVERNNHGHAVLSKARSIITQKQLINVRLAYGHDQRVGWLTTAQSKPQSIDGLAVALRDGLAKIRSQATLDELQIYRIGANGSTSAPPGYYDDRVMAWAIALIIAQRERPAAARENPLY